MYHKVPLAHVTKRQLEKREPVQRCAPSPSHRICPQSMNNLQLLVGFVGGPCNCPAWVERKDRLENAVCPPHNVPQTCRPARAPASQSSFLDLCFYLASCPDVLGSAHTRLGLRGAILLCTWQN